MKISASCGFALLAILSCQNPADARGSLSRAEAVVAKSKMASGGAAWDQPQGCYEEGTHGSGGVAYTTRFSLWNYGMRVESRRGGSTRAMGFNGKSTWQTDAAGKTGVHSEGDLVREAVVTAYLSNNGFFFPKRFPATFVYLRQAMDGGRNFDVLEITPKGGRTIEIWFDGITHLVGRVVDNEGTSPVRVYAQDYRRAGKLIVAFNLIVKAVDGTVIDRGMLTSFRCGSIDGSIFDPPKTP